MASSGKHQWYVGEDGCIPVDEPACNVTYHSALNSIIVTTEEPSIKIYDVTSGSVLQKSDLSAGPGEKVKTMYLPEKNHMVFSNSTAIGVRKDLQGVLLIDTALQTPLSSHDKLVKIELPFADARQLLMSIKVTGKDLPCTDVLEVVTKLLQQQIEIVQEATKGSHKTAKWATVCLNVPFNALKTVCTCLVTEMKRVNAHSPGLSIASAVSDRLGYLLPSNCAEASTGSVDRSLMYSEAARRETFTKWPHMNYKWALPDPMAQAGFYHQPNMSGDDRALCFTCNVCLVCWEPTDEPWSEHERHSPSCPFVKGEHTQNVPLSVTFASQPALPHGSTGEKIACLSTTASEDYVATATKHGSIVVWNLKHKMRKHCQFLLDPMETVIAVKTGLVIDRDVQTSTLPTSQEGEKDKQDEMVDSLEVHTSQGAGSSSAAAEDTPDAKQSGSSTTAVFTVGQDSQKSEAPLQEIPLHGEKSETTEEQPLFPRPNEDIVVTSMCVVEKIESELTECSASKTDGVKKDHHSKTKKRPIQPSVICGVSLRCPKIRSNCEDIQTDVQLMNRVNSSVSGETSPQIIPDSSDFTQPVCIERDILESATSYIPYLLVVSVKEDMKKISKQPSTDSLKPSTSSNNIVPNLSSMTMNPPNWSLLDHMCDLDNDVQITKVTPGLSALSTSSPTEGVSKQEEVMEESSGNSQDVISSDSAIKRLSSPRAGTVLQCLEFPTDLQCEHLEVSSITPTLDKQHLIVVLSPRDLCSSQSSVTSLKNTESSQLTTESSGPSIEVLSTEGSSEDNSKKSEETTESSDNIEGDTNTNTIPVENSESANKQSSGCILVYKFSFDSDNKFAHIDETPLTVRYVDESELGVRTVLILPAELSDQIEEEEGITCSEDVYVTASTLTSFPGDRQHGLYGQMAVIYFSGKLEILNTCDLSILATITLSKNEKFVDVTYCTGIDRLCACSSQGKLYFYQLSEEMPDPSDSIVEGDLTPVDNVDGLFGQDQHRPEEVEHSPRSADVLAKQQLSFDSLCQLHNLIQFENLMPRFTATVPPCWNEMQQEQQQRRHPQHLQQQGEATQHTRTWKLQPDGNTWDEHLFEIVLPRACCVGHVDVKFSINPHCPLTPDIQMTLLKQNINAIGRQTKPEATPVDSKINFNINPSTSAIGSETEPPSMAAVINNVQDPQFLDKHNAEILCGPINIADCLDLAGTSGLVSLTSPQLLMSKPRSLLLHIKGFPNKLIEEKTEKSKEGRKYRNKMLVDKRSIKFLLSSGSSSSSSKTKVDKLKGCDWLTEVSITIRKTKKTHIFRERQQRNTMIELTSFHEKLLSTVAFDEGFLLTGVSPDHVQNMCLDILAWVTSIQMNDPDPRCTSKCILTTIQPKLRAVVQACFIQGSRTTAHKCARLLSQCMQYSKSSIDPEIASEFSQALLEALLACLPLLLCTYSAGGLKWFFTLLNRVKCMDVENTSVKCVKLLSEVAKHFHERAQPQHAVLKARYGLNGHPFETDMFDMELPQAVKEIIPGNTPAYASLSGGPSTMSTGNSSSAGQSQQADDFDFYEFFNTTPEKSTKSLVEYARNHILGMLEVEPLHFSCHSTSDGTKMERLDNMGGTGGTAVINPFGPSTTTAGTMSGTINFGESVPSAAPSSAFNSAQFVSMPYALPQSMAMAKQINDSAKNYQSVKYKIMHIKQMLHEVNKNILPSGQSSTSGGSAELMPSTPKTTPQVMTPPLTPPNEAWQQILLGGDKSDTPKSSSQPRPSLSAVPPTHSMLQPPPPQVLVIERIYSGARRFVILDFGKPVLLTDVIIPLCGDLASLSIDVWVKGEEVDGQRLVVVSDIGVRSLVMNNIMPPPVCRYLKITTIGRYGSGTTRSKIPIGAFYGHSYILPWEWTTRHDAPQAVPSGLSASQLDFPAQSQLLSHLGSFMSLLEDIQCRYSLAKARLGSLLNQVEGLQCANHHTQYYLKKAKNNDEDNSILQAYNECLQLQLQQNLAMRAIDRLQSAIGLRVPTTQYPDNIFVLLKQACTDKLRCILENLLETVISVTNTSQSPLPASLFTILDHSVCQDVFKHLCFYSTPRLQILTGMVLVRVCGTQSWFGEFLGNMLQEYFYSETSQIFSQDRVFVLLTAMGQRALQGPRAVSVMESLLVMLAKVLSPIHSNQPGVVSPTGHLDLTLIGWILLFLCRNLDNTIATNSSGEEQAAAVGSKKSHGANLSNRWNFIAANGNVKSQIHKSQSLRTCRRSLHKRLLHHKQKLMDMDQVKKNFLAQEQAGASLPKQQGKQFWKELTQFASKHLKDIIQIRKTDAEMLRKMPREGRFPEEREGLEYEQDTVLILPKDTCLPVVHGLMALLLSMDFTCNVDLFLITCKVLARVCISTRPAITLTEAMNQEQLERLIMLAANLEFNHGNISWGGPWAGHAITCLLQDILDGERLFPSTQFEGITDDEISSQVTDDSLQYSMDLSEDNTVGESAANDSLSTAAVDVSNVSEIQDTSSVDQDQTGAQAKEDSQSSFYKESQMMVDMLLDDTDDDDTPEKHHAYITGENIQPPSSTANSVLPTMAELIEDKYKPGKDSSSVKPISFFSHAPKIPLVTKQTLNAENTAAIATSAATAASVGQGLSTALDARLELGLETHMELRLRMMLTVQLDALQNAFSSPLPMPSNGGSWSRSSPTDGELLDSGSAIPQCTSFEMLSLAYDDLFSQLVQQRVNMDSLLQLWLTLNEEPSLDSSDSQAQFDPCRCPVVPLSVTSVTNLLACVAMTPSLPVRTWVLVFNSLTLLANLRIGTEEQRSMVVAMMADRNLVLIITKFLSGTSLNAPATTYESSSQVGPSAVKAFHVFLQRLRVCICGEDNIHNLKEIMLKLVYSLTAERGAFHSCLGPLDAQCKFLESILELSYDQVDINNAISVIESVSNLVNRHILCQERVCCRSTSDNGVNARSCFGGMFASLLRGGDSSSRNGDSSRDSLICSLLKLVNKLLQVHFPTRYGRTVSVSADGHGESSLSGTAGLSEPVPDSAKLSQALATSTPRSPSLVGQSDEEKAEASQSSEQDDNPQTDEQKTESANQDHRTSAENPGINLADIILERRGIMCNFIQALSYCNSSTMAMLLGSSGMPSNMQESFTGGDPLSVGDGIYQILSTLSRQCSNSRSLMEALFLYLSGGFMSPGSQSLCRLSEPLLWFMLKVLDSPKMLKMFLDKGGVEVVCRNFVNCNSRIISTSPSLISTIMQNMNGQTNTDKRKKWEPEPSEGIQNFAPLGTIVSCSPTASPAEVLIVSTPQHRRTRSAPWSYHFYPDEAWVDLKITLPFAILLKEVQIQPHSQALSTCPAFVSLEASQDGVTSFPLSAPMNTSSLVYIKLQLQRPEVVTSVIIRLHRARDSATVGLSQILLMGYSAFGEVGYKTNNLFLPTEDFVSRSSVGWIRLLHHCLVSQKEMKSQVAEAAAPTRGLLNTCTALLVSPVSTVYSPTIEAVLLKLGLHSGELGLALIDNLLRSNSAATDHGMSQQYLGRMGGVANESTVEILFQLGTVQDTWTADRLKAMLQWLGDSARVALQRKATFSDEGFRQTPHEAPIVSLPGPAPLHVHCIATVLWQSCETRVEYNLSQLVTKDLVSSLYEWSTVLGTDSHLKRAVDYVLCAVCHICPDSFTRIMEWMGIVITPEFGLTASISDDRKDSSHYHDLMTDDSKEASSARGVSEEAQEDSSTPVILHDIRHMCLDEVHLQTLAVACQSHLATKQLLESGFPAKLARGLFEFCNRVISNFADSWSQPEGISDSCKSMNGTSGDSAAPLNNHNSLTVSADMVEAVLNFFSEISCRPAMKDWLGGADGNIFWPVLLTMLCNTPLHSPISLSAFPQKYELISAEERAAIETASVTFFRNVISCHVANQMLFAKVLYDVIKEQGSANKAGVGICPLSGYTRRLFLQVLLEDENILVAFRAMPLPYQIHNLTNQGSLQHPQFGAGRKFRTIRVNLHMTIGELVNKVSDSPSLAAQLLDVHNGKKSDESKESSTCQIGLELVDVIENMAIGKNGGDKPSSTTTTAAGSTSQTGPSTSTSTVGGAKSSLPPRPPTRRGRNNDPLSKQLTVPMLSLHHKLITNKSLPSDLTLSSLLHVLQQRGLPQGQDVLDFCLSFQNCFGDEQPDLTDDIDEVPDEILLSSPTFPTPLQIFASVGGLALLAEHLPLLYPEISRQITAVDSGESTPNMSNGGDNANDWVTVDNYPEDFYMLYEPMSPAPQTSRGHHLGNLTIPPHSLVAFGLFLRLPGYAEVLLKERKKAQCLLRLMLGVTDDGGGGQILTSPVASTLPTLPFIVLKSLFDTTPVSTDDGVLLRRMCLENGALHLILACLSVLSHHSPRVSMPGFQQEAYSILSAMQAPSTTVNQGPGTSNEKSQQYWAKGTGFGTGSTTSSWDAEQALLRQKSEEEHVTCLLQVLASYINPGGSVPENFASSDYEPAMERMLLPDIVPEMLLQSCLIPALSSYLRNDSVLDMARHVPLYRALLQLLRGISVCPSLVQLLLPLEKENGGEGATAVGELLEKMRSCVDTYASRLKSNKGKTGGTKEEEEENEGLAMLIPDIQETARIVHVATDRLKQHEDHGEEGELTNQEAADVTSQDSVDQIYLAEMQKLQFDQYEMVTEEGSAIRFIVRHHYENNVKAAGDIKNPTRIRRLAQEAVTLSTSLPLSVSSSVFVRCDEERLDIMKVLITGPEDTPYANGCFEFDVYFPQDYPNAPPNINLETTGNHSVRFNPNLYNDGKVCLSVLNTWHGRPEEKWSPQTSSFLQVLVSIQSLILVCEPYFNEPGYERSRGTTSGTASSREYDANIRQATVKWAILEQIKNPPPCFKEVVQKHFWLKRYKILKQCEDWIAEMESYSSDKRTGRTISHNTLALKKHYNQLREEFSKMKAPEGLENVEKGDINPKDKHYSTDQNGASCSKDLPQIVPADSNANSVLTDSAATLLASGDIKEVTPTANC